MKIIYAGLVFILIFSVGTLAQKKNAATKKKPPARFLKYRKKNAAAKRNLRAKSRKIRSNRAAPKPDLRAVTLPKVTQIDEAGLKTALTPNGKPLLVNFWATWCDPCREEFPDLVKINAEQKGKIDFITVSLDDLDDINGAVPKFLSDMKAEMPAYLLKVADESTVISAIAKDWTGGLPFTILYNEKGEIAFFRQGKVKPEMVRAEVEKLAPKPPPQN